MRRRNAQRLSPAIAGTMHALLIASVIILAILATFVTGVAWTVIQYDLALSGTAARVADAACERLAPKFTERLSP